MTNENENQLPANPILNNIKSLIDAYENTDSYFGKAAISYGIREQLVANDPKPESLDKHQQILFDQGVRLQSLQLEREKFEFDKQIRQEKLALDKQESKRRESALVMKMKDSPAMVIGNYIASLKSVTILETIAESIIKLYYPDFNGDFADFKSQCINQSDMDMADFVEAFQKLIASVKTGW